MSTKITELTSKRNRTLSDATALVNCGLKTAEDKEKYQALLAEADIIQSDLDNIAKIERALPSAAIPAPVTVQAPIVKTKPVSTDEKRARLNAAFRSLLVSGFNPEREEQRDLTTVDNTVVIPQEFSKIITDARKYYGPLATLVKRTDSDNGRPLKQVVSDDTAATMSYVAETGATSSLEADPTLRSNITGTDSLVTLVKYSKQELEDADDLEAFIQGIAGLRVSRAVEYALTLGLDNGSNTTLPNSPSGGLLGNVPTGTTTASLAAGIGYDDLVALAGSIDHAYFAAPGSGFMASPATFQYLLSQKDSTSRPYYNIDPATGLLQIAGKPLYINNAMPSYTTASTKAVLFGDFSRAYSYLNGSGVGGMRIRVLIERFADVYEGAALIYTRIGASALVSGAVKALVTAAS